MIQELVASSTRFETRMDLYHWLDSLPLNSPWRRRSNMLAKRGELWQEAVEKGASICVWSRYDLTPRRPEDKEDGEEFFLY